MRASSIRHLRLLTSLRLSLRHCLRKPFKIWSWKTGQQLGEFQTMLDFGGKGLALTPDGSSCIVGAWVNAGVVLVEDQDRSMRRLPGPADYRLCERVQTLEALLVLFRDWQRTPTQSSVRTLRSLRLPMDVRSARCICKSVVKRKREVSGRARESAQCD
jgi:hypothetical protein